MTLPRVRTARRAAEIEPFQVMDVLARAQALEAAGRRDATSIDEAALEAAAQADPRGGRWG